MSADKRRFSKIYRRVWNDARFRALTSPPPNGRTLFLRLLSGPELTNIPGLFSIGELGLADALEWGVEGLREAFAEVEAQGLAKADWKARLVFVPNAIRYNVPESPNVVRSWKQAWDEMPECELKAEAFQSLQAFLKGFGEAFLKAFLETCPAVDLPPKSPPSSRSANSGKVESSQQLQAFGEGSAKPSPNQEQEQEQKKERDLIQDSEVMVGSGEGSQPPASPRAASPARRVKGSNGNRGSRMTESWQPGAALLAWAAQHGIANPLEPLDDFRDYWIAASGSRSVKANWDAAYRNRLRWLMDNGRLETFADPPERLPAAEPEPEVSPEERALVSEKIQQLAERMAARMVIR